VGWLPPEGAGRVAADLGEEIVDVGRGRCPVVGAEAVLVVAAVQRPGAGGLGVAQSCDGGAGPFLPEVLAPWGAPFNDREVRGCDLTLDADLMPAPTPPSMT